MVLISLFKEKASPDKAFCPEVSDFGIFFAKGIPLIIDQALFTRVSLINPIDFDIMRQVKQHVVGKLQIFQSLDSRSNIRTVLIWTASTIHNYSRVLR